MRGLIVAVVSLLLLGGRAAAQGKSPPGVSIAGPDSDPYVSFLTRQLDPEEKAIQQAWDMIVAGHFGEAEDLLKVRLRDRPYDLRLKAALFDVYIGAHRYEDANRLIKVYFEIPHVCESALAIDRDLAQPYGAKDRINTLAPVILRGVCIQAALGTRLDKPRSDYCTYYLGRYFGHLEDMGSPAPVRLPNNSLEVSLLSVGAECACHGEVNKARFYFSLARNRFPKSKMATAAFQGLQGLK